eukprot:5541839-Amphidinium_carterae.2
MVQAIPDSTLGRCLASLSVDASSEEMILDKTLVNDRSPKGSVDRRILEILEETPASSTTWNLSSRPRKLTLAARDST